MKQKIKQKLEERTVEIAITVVLVGIAAAAAQSSGSVLDAGSTENVAAEYRFDSGTGLTVYDNAGTADATLNNFEFNSGSGWTGKTAKGVEGEYPDFEGWSNNPTYVCDGVEMMGGYNNFGSGDSTTKTMNLPEGEYKVTFNYYFGDSWDNEYGRLYWNGNRVWSQQSGGDKFASEDVCGAKWTDGIESPEFSTTVNHNGGQVDLKFNSTLDSSPGDEWFGVNNIEVEKIGGKQSNALQFDGNDDYADISSSSTMPSGSSPFTISTWVKIPETCSTNGGIFGYGNWGSGDQTNALRTTGDCTDVYHYFWGNDDSTSGVNINDGEWHHIAVTYDGGSERNIFVDGQVESTDNPGTVNMQAQDANIGVTANNEYFNGRIDRLNIYTKNLSEDQVRSLYTDGSFSMSEEKETLNGKISEISFDYVNSSYVQDTSGQNNHGRKQNGVNQKSSIHCKVGRCLEFDGSSNTGVDLNDVWNDHTESRTFMFWFKEADSGAASSDRIIGQDCSEWFCLNDNGQDSLLMAIDGYSTNTVSIDQSEWNHVSLVFDESNSNFQFYLNGEKKYEQSYNSGWNHLTRPVVLGGNTEGSDDISGGEWEGKIDQFKVFNQPLTPSEIHEEAESIQSDGSVLDMRFENDGGGKVLDSSLKNNHGSLQPNASYGAKWTEGIKGNGLKFDGNNDLLRVPDDSSFDFNEEIAVGAWFKPESGGDGGGGRSLNLVAKRQGGGGFSDIKFELGYDSNNQITWTVGVNDQSELAQLETSETVEPKTGWHQIIATYSSNTNQMKIYKDGELLASKNYAANNITSLDNDNVWIGGGNVFSDTYYLDGKIDSVFVKPYALSSSEVEQRYRDGATQIMTDSSDSISKQNLVLDQTFDRIETCGQSDTISCPSGMNGDIAVDESGEANHGELKNTPTEVSAGNCKVGKCMSFDESGGGGSGEYVETTSSNGLGQEEITASAWIKPKPSTDSRSTIIYADRFYFQHYNDNQLATYWYGWNKEGYHYSSSNSVPTGEWSHVAVTWDNETGVKMYVNGKLDTQISNTGLGDSLDSIKIGQENSGRRFNGKIDEAQVYRKSLSEKEIWNLYTNGRDLEEGRGGPASHWRFESVTGDTGYDSAGENDGTINGANLSSGVRGVGLELDGSDDFVALDNSFTMEKESATLSWAMKPSADSGLFNRGGGNGGSFSSHIELRGGGTRIFAETTTNCNKFTFDGIPDARDQWKTYTIVFNNSQAYLYIDGSLWGEATNYGVTSCDNSAASSMTADTELQYIGPETYRSNLDGKIDDIRFYPYALSEDQVKEAANKGMNNQPNEKKYGVPEDCSEIKQRTGSKHSGVFRIDPDGKGGYSPFEVYCEMEENGGGWTRLYTTQDGANSGDKGWAFGSNSYKWESSGEVNFGNGNGWVDNTGNNETWAIGNSFMSNYEGKTTMWDYYSANGEPIHPVQVQALSDTTEDGTYYVGSWFTDDIDRPIQDVFAVSHPSDYDCAYGGCMTIFPSSGPNPSVDGDYVLGSNHGSGGTWTDYIDWREVDNQGVPTHLGFRDGNGRIAHWGEGDFNPAGGHTLEFENPYFYAR